MASSSITSSTTNSTASIDVAGMVAGLMSVENVPLTKLQSQITTQNTKISDLGQLKSKAATFQTALKALEDPASFTSAVASSSDTSVLTVTSSAGAIEGSHDVTVTQLAKPAQYIFDGLSDPKTQLGLSGNGNATFTITVGKSPNTTPHPITIVNTTTLQGLSDKINALGLGVAASVTATADGKFALTIQGTKLGTTNDFTVSSINLAQFSSPIVRQAQDALFTLDGVPHSRSTNSVSDALRGTTFNLVSLSSVTPPSTTPNSTTITLAKAADNGPTAIQNMINAFNDLANTAKNFTQSASGDGTTPAGPLAGSPGAVSFIDQIKSMLATGVTYSKAGQSTPLSIFQLGIDIQQDGTLKFNSSEYASTNNIAAILALGINIGSTDFATRDNNLNAFLTSEVQSFGLLDKSITNEQKSLDQLNQKQQDLKTRLNSKQAAYTAQYSSLNALLFTLNQTSNSLTSALAGLTTGQLKR